MVSAVFDGLRFVCDWLFIFGPLLVGAGAGVLANVAAGGGTAGHVAGVVAGVVGVGGTTFFGDEALAPLGEILGVVVGILGWLTVGLLLMISNPRIFKENAGHLLWTLLNFLVSELPLVGGLPLLTARVWTLYSAQIKKEKKALQDFKTNQVASIRSEQQQRAIQMMQTRVAQQLQLTQQEEEFETTNDAEYADTAPEGIPGDVRKAA